MLQYPVVLFHVMPYKEYLQSKKIINVMFYSQHLSNNHELSFQFCECVHCFHVSFLAKSTVKPQ